MTEEDYKEKVSIIEQSYKAELHKLYSQFAAEKRIYNIGDIIKNEQTKEIILIDSYGFYKHYEFPQPVYKGLVLKKDLTKRKDGKKSWIYGNYKTHKINPI